MRDITTQVWCVQKNMYLTGWTCEEDIHRANMIGELVQVRDGQLHLSISQCEVRALIEYVVAPLTRNTVSSYSYIV